MPIQIQYRRGTAAQWSSVNPILALGEPGYESDTGKFKVGNGSSAWNSLPYSSGPTGPTGSLGPTGPSVTGPIGPVGPTGPAFEVLVIPISDETTNITTGNAKVTFRMPFAMTVTAVRASLSTASSSGIPTFDINEGGISILSTKLTIDAGEKTSTTAATAAVISDSSLANDSEVTIDVDVAGTGARGAKIYIIGVRA